MRGDCISAVLGPERQAGGKQVNGVDIIGWKNAGPIDDFKVPLVEQPAAGLAA